MVNFIIYSMRTLKFILLVSLLLLVIHTEQVIQFVDTFGGICKTQPISINRVQRLVNVTYTYPLHTIRRWEQFPDMKIQFYLARKQFVTIMYHLSFRTYGNDFLKSRLIVDGVENPFFRVVSGYMYWRTHYVKHQVFMEEGQHEVYVQYDQTGGDYNMGYQDWATALFQVVYFQY